MLEKQIKNMPLNFTWKITITEFYLNIYSLAGPSGLPPNPADNNGKQLATMTVMGIADATTQTPAGLVFYGYFFPDGTNLETTDNQIDENGKNYVHMYLNLSQLAGLVALLGTTTGCTAQYTVINGQPTSTITGAHSYAARG
jgi:hypothetical protein